MPPAAQLPVTMFLAASRPAARNSSAVLVNRLMAANAVRNYATPAGPPPTNFRQKRFETWDEDKESTLNKMGRFFLLSEMARGMYVLMEQFFRPPYTIYYPFEKVGRLLVSFGLEGRWKYSGAGNDGTRWKYGREPRNSSRGRN